MQLDKASIILSHVKNYKAQDDSCKTHLISLLLSNGKIPKYIITFLGIFLKQTVGDTPQKLTKLFSGLLQPTIEKVTRSFMSGCPFGPEGEKINLGRLFGDVFQSRTFSYKLKVQNVQKCQDSVKRNFNTMIYPLGHRTLAS